MSVDSPEDLYGLTLDRFVPSRTALVKRLRGENRREQASEIAVLRKPSVAAWAVNQLVRTQPQALQTLFDTGDDLARAQDQAAAGEGGGDAMRDATHRQRDAVRELVEAAERLLGSADGPGVSQATIERVGETLRAAANDEDARRQVADGCLTRELRFVGVGIGGLAPSVKPKPSARTLPDTETSQSSGKRDSGQRDGGKRPPVKSDRSARQVDAKRKAQAARKAEAERAAARERAVALKAARRTEAEARRDATRADKELAAAHARQEEAAASLREAETLFARAARRAEDAAAELTAAEQALRDLGQS